MKFRHLQVDPITPCIGAYLSGVDLNDVRSEDVYEEIQQALWLYGVVFLRRQALRPENYLRLGRKFGEMEQHEFFPHVQDFPQIQLIAHQGHDAPETDRWHTDVTFRKKPNLVSILRITDLPPAGGDTMWMSAGAAFEALGGPLQQLLLSLQAEHDLPWHFRRINAYERLVQKQAAARQQAGESAAAPMNAEALAATLAEREAQMIKGNPATVHPAVISHPVTGRKTLFVNSIWTKRLLGLHMDLSEALLNMLFEWIKKPEFMVRFRWEQDSIAIWDNAATQHYAVFDYAPHYRAGQRLTCGSFTPARAPPAQRRPTRRSGHVATRATRE
ncbi:MAG: TauD/TfdA dioxygenase family protein [Rubrivivax sp.]|jgi:taurine dioxygenase